MRTNVTPEPEEFFIGYQSDMPPKTAAYLRKVIAFIGLIMVLAIVLIAVSQREFSKGEFEYGKFTSLDGYLFKKPIPHFRQILKSDSSNISFRTILLVGSGKFGAGKTLDEFESQLGSLEGKYIRITGELIYDKNKTLLQVVSDHPPSLLDQPVTPLSTKLEVGSPLTLRGEVVDPKCYFGVMKPGEGKPHRSCAIRCIAGGIPPVFHVSDTDEHYILLDDTFNPVNEMVLGIVGDNIVLSGRTVQFDNWKLFLVEKSNLETKARAMVVLRTRLEMEKDITLCK